MKDLFECAVVTDTIDLIKAGNYFSGIVSPNRNAASHHALTSLNLSNNWFQKFDRVDQPLNC